MRNLPPAMHNPSPNPSNKPYISPLQFLFSCYAAHIIFSSLSTMYGATFHCASILQLIHIFVPYRRLGKMGRVGLSVFRIYKGLINVETGFDEIFQMNLFFILWEFSSQVTFLNLYK